MLTNPRRYLRFLLLLALGTLAGPLRALDWTKTDVTATPEPGAEVVRARYEFKNPAAKVVQILEVKTSCGCTEATPSASKIGPGETGAIDVLFTIGKRTGLQEKEIILFTDESKVPVRLKLTVKLPEAKVLAEAGR